MIRSIEIHPAYRNAIRFRRDPNSTTRVMVDCNPIDAWLNIDSHAFVSPQQVDAFLDGIKALATRMGEETKLEEEDEDQR